MPPSGPKPRLGAKLVKGNLRLTVQAGLTMSTWYWLVEFGWREETYRADRRAYREVPPSRVAEIFDAEDKDELKERLELAVAEAAARPVVTLVLRR